ncbi:DUF7683 domain-containing protein [Pseudomonas sp. MDT1-16]|uniref:DUF7683 domain-containing protein n=1 Tax=Pseudomonas sp. AL03 TaxID=3042230 RepID=UPI00249B692A|nr:hypothetical protein [Pseudomonas sp. AL03]MDI3271083.1 hypothetical protein [Pseudomonas sp. AL03]
MKHVLMGVPEGEDFASYEKEIPVSVEDLKPILGWAKDDDCVYDYRLTAEQINAIEQLCSLKLPTDLMLFLTGNACYTSPIDTPSGH